MTSIIKYSLICVFLLIACWTSANDSLRVKAERLFEQNEYLQAALVYEEMLFNGADKRECLLQKALCAKALGDFEWALASYGRMTYQDHVDELHYRVAYEKGLALYMTDEYWSCIGELDRLARDTIVQNGSKDWEYLMVLALSEVGKWDDASVLFHEMRAEHGVGDSTKYEGLFLAPKLKKGRTARILSAFLPGGGQFYSGYFFKGMASVVVQVSAGYFLYYHLANAYYLIGSVTGFSVFQAFYLGDLLNADRLAIRKNRERLTDRILSIKEYTLEIVSNPGD